MKKLLLIFSLLFSFSSYAADPIYTKIFSSKAVDGSIWWLLCMGSWRG